MIDTAGARLYMIEDGRIADRMKVVVGKSDPSTQTPMIASTIYYATLNPYWHVSAEMVRSLIAKNVLDQGLGYLQDRMATRSFDHDGSERRSIQQKSTGTLSPPATRWCRCASFRDRSIRWGGEIPFPNGSDIYLHDTPNKALFASDDRIVSHGCIRLEDAERLGHG